MLSTDISSITLFATVQATVEHVRSLIEFTETILCDRCFFLIRKDLGEKPGILCSLSFNFVKDMLLPSSLFKSIQMTVLV